MNPEERDSILHAFAIEPKQDRGTLERYLRQYPEVADELLDLSLELLASEAVDQLQTEPVLDESCESAWIQFRDCRSRVVNPEAFFFPRGKAFAELAEKLKVPRSILAAIRDGRVLVNSIPRLFTKRLAEAAGSSPEALTRYYANPQPALAGMRFKSAKKPQLQEQVSFEELVRNSDLTDEERHSLLQD